MSFTFGNRPEDVVTDSRGNTLSGVTLTFYASKADASEQINPLGSATSVEGVWAFESATLALVWARTPSGMVYPVGSADGQLATTEQFLAAVSDSVADEVNTPGTAAHSAIVAVADSAGGINVVAAAGAAQSLIVGRNYLTLTSPLCTLSLPASPAVGLEVFVSLKQDATGNRNVTWPAVEWPYDVVPATLDAASAVDEFSLRWDGALWRGVQIASYA